MTPPDNKTIPYGYCQCGCGRKTLISKRNRPESGMIKGAPVRYCQGHWARIYLPIEEGPTFKINGVYCRLIPLSRGQYTIVWDSDYKDLMKWKWHAFWNKGTRSYYAMRKIHRPGLESLSVYMHRQLLGLALGDPEEVDHKDPMLTLHNTRDNIRRASRGQNCMNQRLKRTNTSGFKGVFYHSRARRWSARIHFQGKMIHIGLYDTKAEASAAYWAKAQELFGEFARIA